MSYIRLNFLAPYYGALLFCLPCETIGCCAHLIASFLPFYALFFFSLPSLHRLFHIVHTHLLQIRLDLVLPSALSSSSPPGSHRYPFRYYFHHLSTRSLLCFFMPKTSYFLHFCMPQYVLPIHYLLYFLDLPSSIPPSRVFRGAVILVTIPLSNYLIFYSRFPVRHLVPVACCYWPYCCFLYFKICF